MTAHDSDSVRGWRIRIQADLETVEARLNVYQQTWQNVRDLEALFLRLEDRLNVYQRDLQVLVARLDERLDRHETWLRFLIRLFDLVKGFLIFVWQPHAEDRPDDENWSL
jgi:hypothetical protein